VDVLTPEHALLGAQVLSGDGAVAVDTENNTVTWNGIIAAEGGTVVLEIEAFIRHGTLGWTIGNQAQIFFDGDADGTNKSSTVSDDPTTPGAGDSTDFIVGDSTLFTDDFESGTTPAWSAVVP
ncbi:MAG: hypothetical protein GY856_34780, partial [bacterium]|nr:hypothetical protein [bacterium]